MYFYNTKVNSCLGLSIAKLATVLVFLSFPSNLFGATDEHHCDRLAAFPDDPFGVVEGVSWDRLNAELAIDACEQAVTDSPTEPRFLFLYGRALLKAKRFKDALAILERAKTQGYVTASHLIGVVYFNAWGVNEDRKKAAENFRPAASAGLPLAQYALGHLLESGSGVKKDLVQAADWYRKAADPGLIHPRIGEIYSELRPRHIA